MDKRKENGGHSTKTKGVDKRKNPYRDVIHDTVTSEDLRNVLKMLIHKSVNKQDIQAAKLLLEYTMTKPTQSMDITSNGENITFNDLVKFGNTQS